MRFYFAVKIKVIKFAELKFGEWSLKFITINLNIQDEH